jgi:PKD repeat protein
MKQITLRSLFASTCRMIAGPLLFFAFTSAAQTGHVVISQVYGGGGLNGATYTHDFIELFNPTGSAVSLAGWSVQYTSATGTSWQSTALSGTIAPGGYFLVRQSSSNSSIGAPLPTPDVIGNMSMSAGAGKVVLLSTSTLIAAGTSCPSGPNVVDRVGYGSTSNCFEGTGPTPTLSATFAAIRQGGGCVDTNNTPADFVVGLPSARNSASPATYCYPVQLVITSINPATPAPSAPFVVTVEARNAGGMPQGVLMNTTINLVTNGNAGAIGGTVSAVMAQGSSSVTITGVALSSPGTGVTLTASRISGQLFLQPGTSAPFAVVDGSNTLVQFTSASNSVAENAGSVDVTVSILSPSASVATSVLVALTGGNNSMVGGFTSQVITFPAGSSSPITITLPVLDDTDCFGINVLNFALENVTGGMGNSGVGTPSNHVLTITDDDQVQGVQVARQYFDGAGGDNWAIVSGGGNVSTTVGVGEFPQLQRILSAPASWQVNNANATLELGTVFPNQWSSMVLRARVASISTTSTNGADAGDMVRFFVNIDGAGFPNTADLTITGLTNAYWGFSTGTAVASTTAGMPAIFTPPTGGALTSTGYSYVEIAIPNGAQSIALRINAMNNAAQEIWAIDNIELVANTCPQTWYSEASGALADPIWSMFPGGSPGPAIINEAANVVVQGGYTVSNTGTTQIASLTVENGGTLMLAPNTTLVVNGNSVLVDGQLQANAGAITLAGVGPTLVGGSSTIQLDDLTVNTPNGTNLATNVVIRGTLQLQQGEFNASGGSLTLQSSASGTGRLGPVPASASYTGNMIVQRYIPGGGTNWRLMGSPVAGATVNQWKDDFFTAGFPGSHYPNFYDPPGSGIFWPSIRWYNETLASPDPNVGVVGVASNLTPLEQGRGFAAWSGDNLGGTAPFVVDVTGAPHIAQEPIALPMSYTNTGSPAADGFNLVSNPLPSAIDFTSIQRGADVMNAYYIYDPVTGNNLAWSQGFGVGAANGIIQSSQGFWIKANGPAATATVQESAKVNVLSGGVFGGLIQPGVPQLRLRVSSAINSFSDESLLVFGEGTPALDAIDAPKFVYAHPSAPQIATRSSDGHAMQIDFHGSYEQGISIPVSVNVAVSGTYTLSATLMGISGLSCVSIEDLSTGAITPLTDGATYSFSINAADDWSTPRFMLHASAPLPFSVSDVLCGGQSNGMMEVDLGEGAMDLLLADAFGVPVQQASAVSGVYGFGGLATGAYMLTVSGTSTVCGSLVQEFLVNSPFVLEGELVESLAASCDDSMDGHLVMIALGGVEPYSFQWSNGTEGESIVDVPGTYGLSITDGNGCTWSNDALVIPLDDSAPVAQFSPSDATPVVNSVVNFTNTSLNAESNFWTFGDGATSEENQPAHIYTQPGTYMVTLAVSAGSCFAVHSEEITVLLGTSVTERPAFRPNAWAQGEQIVVEHAYTHGGPVVIEVLDATGRLHVQRTVAGTPGRYQVPATGLSTGIWFVRMSSGEEQRSFRVPLVR